MLTQLRYSAKSEADNNIDGVDGNPRVHGASSSVESQRVLEERTIDFALIDSVRTTVHNGPGGDWPVRDCG
jgi:hypothetical protein